MSEPKHEDYKKMISALDNRGRFRTYVKGLGLDTGKAIHDNKDINLDWFILLNKHNSEIIEEKIKEDDGYIQFTKMLVHYHCLINKANPASCKECKDLTDMFPKYNYNAVLAIVRMIDVENSTNVWRFNRDKLRYMVNYIVTEEPGNNFWSRLDSENEKERKQLVIDLVNSEPDEDEEDSGESENKAKPNSLASKVCKYFAQYIYKDEKQKKYFINDSFVRKTLPYYYYYYTGKKTYQANNKSPVIGINKTNTDHFKYDELFDVLDVILNEANKGIKEDDKKITRGEMDHIMWYCYKNSGNSKRSKADEEIYILCEKIMLAYGAFPIKDALEILNKDKKKNPLTPNSFRPDNLPNGCVVRDGYIINSLISEERIAQLIESTKANKACDFKKVKLSELAVIENSNELNLLSYLIEIYGEENRDLIITKINKLLNEIIKDEIDLEATFATFTNLVQSKAINGIQVNSIKTKIKKILNGTRLPKYLGHTKEEYDRLVSAS